MEVSVKRFKLENINYARDFILGIATLLIMYFHTYIDYNEIISNKFLADFICSDRVFVCVSFC